MATVKIVTDSAQDFEPSLLEKMGITVVPLTVHFGEESYRDGYEIRGKEFYERLTSSSVIARTSQPSPWEFQEVFQRLTEDGSSVVAILLSSALSGTYQSAVMAKEALPDRQIEVIDSKSASGMYGMMAILAQEMAGKGSTFDEIVAAVKRMIQAGITVFSVDTLDYLARNGRIGKAQHLLGSMLNMKPILSLDDEGYVVAKERIRGRNKVIPRMVDIVLEHLGEEELYVCVSDANSPTEAAKLKEQAQERLNIRRLFETEIGAIIGTHTGPGTLALLAIPCRAV
ncbi:MAG: DegV family protein [Firmicutes bacterium]|nr:DegV family protein [Candidatus Fermentithermobacillaceae bacterium]HON87550.1 DegV family protein [Bacillota bacterium]HOV66392.1 DegV family protein [Bacillota bacterium]HRC53616.1 DegV family protein [Bacillota bacterium]